MSIVEVVSDNVIVVRLFVRTLSNLKVITLLNCIKYYILKGYSYDDCCSGNITNYCCSCGVIKYIIMCLLLVAFEFINVDKNDLFIYESYDSLLMLFDRVHLIILHVSIINYNFMHDNKSIKKLRSIHDSVHGQDLHGCYCCYPSYPLLHQCRTLRLVHIH